MLPAAAPCLLLPSAGACALPLAGGSERVQPADRRPAALRSHGSHLQTSLFRIVWVAVPHPVVGQVAGATLGQSYKVPACLWVQCKAWDRGTSQGVTGAGRWWVDGEGWYSSCTSRCAPLLAPPALPQNSSSCRPVGLTFWQGQTVTTHPAWSGAGAAAARALCSPASKEGQPIASAIS